MIFPKHLSSERGKTQENKAVLNYGNSVLCNESLLKIQCGWAAIERNSFTFSFILPLTV